MRRASMLRRSRAAFSRTLRSEEDWSHERDHTERPGCIRSMMPPRWCRADRGERWWGWLPSTPRPRQGAPDGDQLRGRADRLRQHRGQDMTELIRLALKNRATGVVAVPVADEEGYEAAFAALAAMDDIGVVICDSVDREVQQSLRDSAAAASAARRERIAVAAGGAGETVTELLERAKALNSERVVLVAPGAPTRKGKPSPASPGRSCGRGYCRDNRPRPPPGGAVLSGLYGLETTYGDNDLDLLIRGGVTPAERTGGVTSVVRGVTTHEPLPTGRRTPPGESCPPSWWWTT